MYWSNGEQQIVKSGKTKHWIIHTISIDFGIGENILTDKLFFKRNEKFELTFFMQSNVMNSFINV